MVKKHLWFILPLFFLGLFALKAFWGPNFYDGHDAQNHIVRLYQYDLALKDGQFPPRWAGNLMAGYGYPVFIFAYPLPYAISEAFHLLGFNLAVSIKLTLALAYLTSILAMYFFTTNYWQSRKAGFLSALLWAYAPYMFVKLFITASLGVVVSYAFIPIFFLILFNLVTKPNLHNSLYLSLAASAWLMSHSFTPIIFSPLILLFLLFNLKKSKSTPILKYIVISILFTIGLTAWYLLPALTELKYTHFAEFVTHAYNQQFVSFQRLIYSKWGTGAPGWSDNPLSQQVGLAQWLAIALSSILILKHKSKQLLPFLITFFLSIFLMLSISKPVWDNLPLLATVHIPWRFLSLSVFTAAVSVGFILTTKLKPIIKNSAAILLIFLALYGNRNHLRINEVRKYDQQFFQNYTSVATGWNEHLPIWIKDIPKQFPQSKVDILSGNCNINNLKYKSNLQSFTTDCTESSTLQLNTAYYPGWQIIVNNQDITDKVKAKLGSSNGIIQFSLNPGQYQIIAQFKDTPLRRLTKYLSLLALILVIYSIPLLGKGNRDR